MHMLETDDFIFLPPNNFGAVAQPDDDSGPRRQHMSRARKSACGPAHHKAPSVRMASIFRLQRPALNLPENAP
jgi:hypothetical protein